MMTAAPVASPAALTIERLSVRFGGLVAVDNVTLSAAPGRITGLLGPNGAGKTTIFNACSGLVSAGQGTIRLDGRRLNGSSPARRASWGLGRTFQRPILIDSATVTENVAMGLECRYAGRRWWSQLAASPTRFATCRDTTTESLDRCGIGYLADVTVGTLSIGQRRLVELARALTGRFRFLLLDEPSSGLDETETEAFGNVLLDVVARDGTGILLVEHDMSLVRQVCDYLYVLDFGRQILEGPTADVLASKIVQSAYFGEQSTGPDEESANQGRR